MLLAIDIGNSHTVVGVFDGERLAAEWRVTTHDLRTSDEVAVSIRSLLRDGGFDLGRIDRVGIASVVPPLTGSYERMARTVFRLEPVLIHGSLDIGFRILYHDPTAVGADRLCNAIAGFRKYGGPLVIVDFGTATTYDVVGANGDYWGGVIAPGVETSAADLHRRAAKLPRVDLTLPPDVIGRDTVGSMQSGILYGAIDATEGMIRRLTTAIMAEAGTPPTVIATGGFSAFLQQHSSLIAHHEPSLVLDGIRLICDRISQR
ncbi:MAG: type III pantothenate kinase [Bacteroidetes bacterium]|jgi:type III pantothenate kinase|nr:type III pantothenate kinase [Bacteroidota bacterium]